MRIRVLLIVGMTVLTTYGTSIRAEEPSAKAPRDVIAAAYGAILRGDGATARMLLRQLPVASLEPKNEQFRVCALVRLDPLRREPPPNIADPFTREVLDTYRSYWRLAAAYPDWRNAAEESLRSTLQSLLNHPDAAEMAVLEPLLVERLKQAGYHALLGKTGTLRELMLWSRQDERTYRVALPEGAVSTKVFLLNGFESMGWGNYLTCERSGTGGWAKPDGLYAVVPAYRSLEDETFQVNFLAHESQHFSDYQRFPELESWELEYRAKLVELALARDTLTATIEKFSSSQSTDKTDAHSYANASVLRSIREQLGLAPDADLTAAPPDQIRNAAITRLKGDTLARSNGTQSMR